MDQENTTLTRAWEKIAAVFCAELENIAKQKELQIQTHANYVPMGINLTWVEYPAKPATKAIRPIQIHMPHVFLAQLEQHKNL